MTHTHSHKSHSQSQKLSESLTLTAQSLTEWHWQSQRASHSHSQSQWLTPLTEWRSLSESLTRHCDCQWVSDPVTQARGSETLSSPCTRTPVPPKPCTRTFETTCPKLETMCTQYLLDTMYFHQKFDKKSEITPTPSKEISIMSEQAT